jgi:predicted RNA-binding protein
MNTYKAITQVEENYGDATNPVWKYKFGQEIVVEAGTEDEAYHMAEAMVGVGSSMFMEWVVCVDFLSEDVKAWDSLECAYGFAGGSKGVRGGHI